MKVKSAEFIKGIAGDDEILENKIPHVAFIGRSNVGKSSVINSFVNQRNLARSSSTAGRTREINFFLINRDFYLVDLPGYGFAKASKEERENIQGLIYWYLFDSGVKHKQIVMIVDAKIGLTELDLDMLRLLTEHGKTPFIVANKIDRIKKSEYSKQIKSVQLQAAPFAVLPYSAETKIGVRELLEEISK